MNVRYEVSLTIIGGNRNINWSPKFSGWGHSNCNSVYFSLENFHDKKFLP